MAQIVGERVSKGDAIVDYEDKGCTCREALDPSCGHEGPRLRPGGIEL